MLEHSWGVPWRGEAEAETRRGSGAVTPPPVSHRDSWAQLPPGRGWGLPMVSIFRSFTLQPPSAAPQLPVRDGHGWGSAVKVPGGGGSGPAAIVGLTTATCVPCATPPRLSPQLVDAPQAGTGQRGGVCPHSGVGGQHPVQTWGHGAPLVHSGPPGPQCLPSPSTGNSWGHIPCPPHQHKGDKLRGGSPTQQSFPNS